MYVALQPYFVSRNFRRAYQNEDFAVAESFVDFPELRDNLLRRARNSYSEPETKDQAASMHNLGNAFMLKMIEATVRPGGFEAMAKLNQSNSSDVKSSQAAIDWRAWNRYEGLNVFTTELYVKDDGETATMIKLFFRRNNLHWKLYDAELFGKI